MKAPRQQSSQAALPSLYGVRAVAAYVVIATHVGFHTGRSVDHSTFSAVLSRLDFGVTLFFLLSGFLLFRPFAGAILDGTTLPAVGMFLWRRALRILPAYWLTIVVTLGVLSTRTSRPGDWWSYLLLIQTYNTHNVDPSLSQMWTLVVEISFYLALPLIALAWARLCARANRRTREIGLLVLPVVLMVAAIAWRLWAAREPSFWPRALLWLPAYLDWFALGMLVAVVSLSFESELGRRVQVRCRRWSTDITTCLSIGVVLFLLATLPLAGPRSLLPPTLWERELKHFLYAASAFALFLPIVVTSGTLVHRVLSNAFFRWLGEISYGVYLWHLPMLVFIQQRWLDIPLFSPHFVFLYTLTATSATALAATSYYLLERPLLNRWSRGIREGSERARQEIAATHNNWGMAPPTEVVTGLSDSTTHSEATIRHPADPT
jgi:peptidoglycan/LPS O-acetylase OafA/YrhL